jgi:hypothetical protein
MKKDPNQYPPGWNRTKVRRLIAHYEGQTDEQAIAEAEASYRRRDSAWIQVPLKLLPEVRRILAKSA